MRAASLLGLLWRWRDRRPIDLALSGHETLGFGGRKGSVGLLTPYEMLLHYSMVRLLPPMNARAMSRAAWAEEDEAYWKQCREEKGQGSFKPGQHCQAIEA